jgi:crossover junction endodeoxyribonuclease RuvC
MPPDTLLAKNHIIIGVDPGTIITGYGLICVENSSYRAVDYGCIRPPRDYKLSDRYLVIFDSICALLDMHKPAVLVVETQYVDKNIQSAIKLGMARGVIIVAAKSRGIPVFEYSPTKAKLSVVGNGRASKGQVQGMVQRLLRLKEPPCPEDASDALALAICHAQSQNHHATASKEI